MSIFQLCIVLTSAGLFFAWLFSVYIIRWTRYRQYAGPLPLPIIGNALEVKAVDGSLSTAYTNMAAKYGDMFLFFLGVEPVLVTADHTIAKEIMVRQFKQFHDRPRPPIVAPRKRAAAIEASILNASGNLWTTLRAASQPVFHAESLSRYASVMNEAASLMNARIAAFASKKEPFELGRLAGMMTICVILNVDIEEAADGSEHPVVTAAKVFFKRGSFGTIWTIIIGSFPAFFRPMLTDLACALGDFKEITGARDVFFSLADQLARSYCEANSLPPFEKDLELLGKGAGIQVFPPDTVPSDNSIIAAMMRARFRDVGTPLQAVEVLQQTLTFLAAGYETTATAVLFTVYLLARNPAAEAELLKEIDANGRTTLPTYETLDKWEYAKACFREALRLYPVAPVIPRLAGEATTVAGHEVPRGTAIHVNIFQMHRDPNNFLDPEAFKPERFLNAAAQGNSDLHPAYMPFGAGPRNCIGLRMAQEEGILMVIRLYQSYIFRLCEAHHPPGSELPLRMGITIAPKDGLWVNAVAR